MTEEADGLLAGTGAHNRDSSFAFPLRISVPPFGCNTFFGLCDSPIGRVRDVVKSYRDY